jgi:hypothetical protein
MFPTTLKKGETMNVEIIAACDWNNTGIILEEGQTYDFHAFGNWIDSIIFSDANGYQYDNPQIPWYSKLGNDISDGFQRFPNSQLFKLIGCIDNQNECFEIGVNNTITANKTGILYCYANDFSVMYGNNLGKLRLNVTHLY